jgi:hypothetical protein
MATAKTGKSSGKSKVSKQTKLNLKMREMLASAYGFVRGRQYTDSIANITYEELLDKAIGRIEGTKGRSDVRATKLDRIKKIKNEIAQAITTVKSKPPSAWKIENDDRVQSQDKQNTKE